MTSQKKRRRAITVTVAEDTPQKLDALQDRLNQELHTVSISKGRILDFLIEQGLRNRELARQIMSETK